MPAGRADPGRTAVEQAVDEAPIQATV